MSEQIDLFTDAQMEPIRGPKRLPRRGEGGPVKSRCNCCDRVRKIAFRRHDKATLCKTCYPIVEAAGQLGRANRGGNFWCDFHRMEEDT